MAAVDDAVLSAQAAFEAWRRTAPARRRDLLVRLADLMVEHGDDIVRLGIADNGRPARSGAPLAALAAEWTRYNAGWADKIIGDVTGSPPKRRSLSATATRPAPTSTWPAAITSASCGRYRSPETPRVVAGRVAWTSAFVLFAIAPGCVLVCLICEENAAARDRTFREWVLVGDRDPARWAELIDEARAFAGGKP